MSSNPLDRFHAAIGIGDIASAKACFCPDAIIWQNFVGEERSVDQAAIGWESFLAMARERAVIGVRRQKTSDGFVQQHISAIRGTDGEVQGWVVCLVVEVVNDRIARLEEYLDPASLALVPQGAFS